MDITELVTAEERDVLGEFICTKLGEIRARRLELEPLVREHGNLEVVELALLAPVPRGPGRPKGKKTT